MAPYAKSMGGNPGPVPANRGPTVVPAGQTNQPPAQSQTTHVTYTFPAAKNHALSVLKDMPYSGHATFAIDATVHVHALGRAVNSALADEHAAYRADIGAVSINRRYVVVNMDKRPRGVWD